MAGARTLILTHRNLRRLVPYCILEEGERIFASVDAVDFVDPRPRSEALYFKLTRMANATYGLTGLSLPRAIDRDHRIERDYDLFFFFCAHPMDLVSLSHIKGWRERSRKAVCWIEEAWSSEFENHRKLLRLLEPFDQVFFSVDTTIPAYQAGCSKPIGYLPTAVDALRFCPYPLNAPRCIDFLSIGRRPSAVHRGLQTLAERESRWYHYDTLGGRLTVAGPHREHREGYMHLLQRAKYFVANRAKFDDQPLSSTAIGTQQVIAGRFFEGAAAGTIMIGQPTDSDAFRAAFDWPQPVTPVALDGSDLEAVVRELDASPERVEAIRRDGVRHSLRRHDWVYRWEAVLRSVGMDPLPALHERKARLEAMAATV